MSQHFARVENSPRLQRILDVLKDGNFHSTLEIQNRANVCSVGSSASELRANGYMIEVQQNKGHYEYRLVIPVVKTTEIKEQEELFGYGHFGQAKAKG